TYHQVIAGEHDKSYYSNEDVQVLKPAQVFNHPNWDPSTINNDIALIKLANPARLGTNVSPVCLAESSDYFAPGSTCGDSGGPLVCEKDNVWTLVGIVSWGSRRCSTSTPAVYARVTELRGWVDQILAAN
ncbi:hypothetical protein GOODEAATRI_025348, partial [Goodea atripinnis]